MKYTVVTTFNAAGYHRYGQRMLQTWLKNWPKTVQLIVYAENCHIGESSTNVIIRDLLASSKELVDFKTKWQHIPFANGDVSGDPVRSQRKDSGKGFKWDAVRFSHKVYSIFHCAKNVYSDWLIWMDADTVCHSAITEQDIANLCPDNRDLCFLGRRGKFSECGLYAMNLRSQRTQNFLTEFQQYYDEAEQGIFKLAEWHDSFVFDVVRKRHPLIELDWSSHLITGEGHPLINSDWGAWLDHLKGDRKKLGRSKPLDLKVPRVEEYWK